MLPRRGRPLKNVGLREEIAENVPLQGPQSNFDHTTEQLPQAVTAAI